MENIELLTFDLFLLFIILVADLVILVLWQRSETKKDFLILILSYTLSFLFGGNNILFHFNEITQIFGMIILLFGFGFYIVRLYRRYRHYRLTFTNLQTPSAKNLPLSVFFLFMMLSTESFSTLAFVILDFGTIGCLAYGIWLSYLYFKIEGTSKHLFVILIFLGSIALMGYWVIIDLGYTILPIVHLILQLYIHIMAGMMAVVEVFDQRKHQLSLQLDIVRNQRLESLGIMAGGIAHDFNNILMSFSGGLELLTFTELDKEQQDLLQIMEDGIQQAKNLTQKFLTFTKSHVIQKENIKLKEMFESSWNLIGKGSKCTFSSHFSSNHLKIEGDPGQINQVINNLLINAIQSMPEGGHVSVEAKTCDNIALFLKNLSLPVFPRHVKRNLPSYSSGIIIQIKDEGTGISSVDAEKIFTPYFTTKETGTGLGLATSYSIIQKHQGRLFFTADDPQGTSFYIILPEIPSSPHSPPPSS